MIWEWIKAHETLVWWIGLGSIVTFVGSLVLLPMLVVRMSPDYFMPERESDYGAAHPVARVVGLVGKNLLGLLLLLAGIGMLFIPGQGLLTMLMGLALMDFPGKRALETKLVRRPRVNGALNWIRRKYGRDPLQVP